MRTISYRAEDLKKVVIELGFVGENEHTQVIIDCTKTFAEYPEAEPTMKVQPPRGTAYPRAVTREGNCVIWNVKDSDLAERGRGEIQLTFTNGTKICKTYVGKTNISRSIVGSCTVPSPVQDWIDEASEVLGNLEDAEVNQPVIGEDGYWYTWDQENGEYVKTDTKAQGEDGDPGQPGTDATPDLITVPYEDLTFPVAAGTQCYHDGKLYEANQAIQSSEQWTAAHWTETTVEGQLATVKSDLQAFPQTAAAGDVGKVLKLKTVEDGKPKEYEYGTSATDPAAIASAVDSWLSGNITNPSNPPLDKNLALSNAAAPADVVGKKFPISPIESSFFEDFNYGVPQNVEYVPGIYADNDGVITESVNAKSLIFNCEPNTTYYMFIPSRDRDIFVESDSDFAVGQTYTKLTVNTGYLAYGGGSVRKFTTGATAKRVLTYFRSGSYDYEANKNNIIITKGDFFPDIVPSIKNNALNNVLARKVKPTETEFFEGGNLFVPELATFFKGRYVDTGKIKSDSSTNSVMFPVEPNTVYWFYVPNINRGYVVENTTNEFNVGSTFTQLAGSYPNGNPITFTTGATAKYVLIYFKGSDSNYDWDANKGSVVLNKDVYVGASVIPHIDGKFLENGGTLNGAKVLIFGDSITSCCNLTINGSNETTAYEWRNPSNTYTDGGGNTVNYSMWAKILKESQFCGEIRNYAYPGAEYKTATRPSGDERMNLHYQIDVAMNDLDNPHNVFTVANYVPDIVIFALGTNDGTPNDTCDSAMEKTVLKSDGYSIDVEATLANLDETKFCESARKAYLRIKEAFPVAQIFVVLPIQRSYNEGVFGTLHTYLKQMAERNGAVIIDGAANSGITREFNNREALGLYLKDGLHPNEKGQNLLARLIISSLKANYMPFGYGFNQ